MKNTLTERDVLDRLGNRHTRFFGNGPRYAIAEHVRLTAGHDSPRICDFMAMDLWAGYGVDAGPKLHGFEVKVSRSDWLIELKDPEKAESFAAYCDFWWLVAADASIVKDDLPDGWGLLVGHGAGLREVVPAARRVNPFPMPRDLQATLMRSTGRTYTRRAFAKLDHDYDRYRDRPVRRDPASFERSLSLAISDPGAFVKRGDNYEEPLTSWQRRAVQAVIGGERKN